jgi:hypothetical protein
MAPQEPVLFRRDIYLVATSRPRHWFARFFPPATRMELWGGIGFILIAIIGAVWVLKARSDALALERDPVTIDGIVVRKWVTHGKGAGKFVAYEYTAGTEGKAPRTFHGDARVNDAYFERLNLGGSIGITACRTDPANHYAVGGPGRVFSSVTAVVVSLCVLAFLALVGGVHLWWWWVCRRMPRQTQFLVSIRQ